MSNVSDVTFSLAVGDALSDFSNVSVQVERLLRGGFGLVVVGPDALHDGAWTALKTLHPALWSDTRAAELFVREALTWIGVWPQANILRARFLLLIHNIPFLWLDYAEHGSLRDWLVQQGRQGQPDPMRALDMAQMIAAGLAYLHTPQPDFYRPEPIVHYDLKPENILLGSDGRLQIADFGLARSVEGADALDRLAAAAAQPAEPIAGDAAAGGELHTRPVPLEHGRRRLGTPPYMAPELWRDAGAATQKMAADVYAFGIILSELFAGRRPFMVDASAPADAWRAAHLGVRPLPLPRGPAILRELDALYRRCLAKEPVERPAAAAVLDELRALAQAHGAVPYTPPEVVPRDPSYVRAHWSNLSAAYLHVGLYAEALAYNDRALEADEARETTLIVRGNILQHLDRAGDALKAYDAALALTPAGDQLGRKRVFYNRGILYNAQGHYAEAEAAYAAAVAVVPEDANAWSNRANNLREWGLADVRAGKAPAARAHYRQALACAERAEQLAPKKPQVQRVLALLRQAMAEVDTHPRRDAEGTVGTR